MKCSLLDNSLDEMHGIGTRERSVSVSTSSQSESGISPESDTTADATSQFGQSPTTSGLADLHQSVSNKLLAQSSRRSSSAEDPFPYFDKFMLPSGTEREAAWINDLELMHHYSIATSTTLPRAQEELHVWQRLVPSVAFRYPYLVHQVMAVSGFHLAYLHPPQRETHSLHASQHQHKAIQGIRDALITITSETCHALFIASSLLMMGAFAAFANNGKHETGRRPTIENVIDTFILNRGVASVLNSFQDHISTGLFKDLFRFQTHNTPQPFLDQFNNELRKLSAMLKTERIDPVVAILADYEISKLITAVEKAVITISNPETRVTTYWPITIAEDYITLLRQRNEIAMVIIAYYCVIMHRAEDSCWFLRGWGASVAADIEGYISPQWHEAVRWPLEYIRHNPPRDPMLAL